MTGIVSFHRIFFGTPAAGHNGDGTEGRPARVQKIVGLLRGASRAVGQVRVLARGPVAILVDVVRIARISVQRCLRLLLGGEIVTIEVRAVAAAGPVRLGQFASSGLAGRGGRVDLGRLRRTVRQPPPEP